MRFFQRHLYLLIRRGLSDVDADNLGDAYDTFLFTMELGIAQQQVGMKQGLERGLIPGDVRLLFQVLHEPLVAAPLG